MQGQGTETERMACLTAATLAYQKKGQPVHTWPTARLRENDGWEKHYARVSSLMTTDLFTVGEHDVIDLAASLMDWRHIRHVPVEDNAHRLVGLVTHRRLLRALTESRDGRQRPIPVREVMVSPVITAEPNMPSLEAVGLMKKHQLACLPVIENGRLVGILSERDFMKIFGEVLESFLRSDPPPAQSVRK